MRDTPSNLLKRAKAGDANAAAELWHAIDAGKVDDVTAAAWAREVAVQVVAKVLNPDIPANRRAENARAALGLEGRLEANPELKSVVWIFADHTPTQILEVAELTVDFQGKTRMQARKQIENILYSYRKAQK